jgi:pilus assembly protein TadC
MKFPTLFTKIPKHRRFNFSPRHYDPQEEERKAREERIRKEVTGGDDDAEKLKEYRTRIAGSFRAAREKKAKKFDPSANILRLVIITILVLFVIAYLHYGNVSIYFLALLIPVYIWIRFVRK